MEDFKNIAKVVGCLVGFMAVFYFYFFVLPADDREVERDVLEECIPLQYDFRVVTFYENRYYNFEGITKNGRKVKFKLPKHWNLSESCSVGDSIHKVSGEKELYVIKCDTMLRLPLKVHGEEI